MRTLKKFLLYYKPYLAIFFMDLLCATIISVVDLAYPQLLRSLTRTLFLEESGVILRTLPWISLLLLAGYAVQALCKYYVTCQGHVMGAYMERDMRRELFEHYERLSFSYYDRNNTGQLMSRLVSDLFDISELAHHGPENLFISLIKIIGSFTFLFMIQSRLAVLLLLVVLVMIAVSVRQNRRMRTTFLDNRRKVGDINAALQDSLAGIRIVQSFTNEEVERRKFAHGNESFLCSKKENYRAMGTFQSCNAFFLGLMYVVMLSAGGYLVAQGKMSAGDLAMYALYIGIFTSPIQILVELTEMLQKGMSGFVRFREVVETKPDITDAPNAAPIARADGDIVFDDVSFSYEAHEMLLKHLSFTVRSGESVALVGPSGGGKTTICSLIPRFYDITGGSIRIGGQDIRDLSLKSLRAAIGIVQQDVYLFAGTVRDNIAYGRLDATEEEIVEAAKKAYIHNFIISLPDGYDTFVGERGARLSGGQKQRISIARIFLKDPPILILDEATSALDNESEEYIQRSLDELAKGRTTLTIAHRLSTIKNAEEILVIDGGEDGTVIRERGSHEELLARNGVYARYYRLSLAR